MGYDLAVRIKAALAAYPAYLGKSLWPQPLAVLCPLAPQGPTLSAALAAAGLLILISAGALALVRRTPALATGWFWFAGTLVPVTGIVQAGMQASADRYTYVPHIGLFMGLVGGAAELGAHIPRLRAALAPALVIVVIALYARTTAQVPIWRDEATLYLHAATATKGNWLMHHQSAIALAQAGRHTEAIVHYEETLRLQPRHLMSRPALAELLQRMGRLDEAFANFRQAALYSPDSPHAQMGMADILELRGNLAAAVVHYGAAVRLDPANSFYRALLEQASARMDNSR